MKIDFVRILRGITAMEVRSVNDVFRGRVLLEDGSIRHAIVKDLNGHQLANEILVSLLARSVGLPVPDVYLGVAEQSVLSPRFAPKTNNDEGIFFVSADVASPNIAQVLTGDAGDAAKNMLLEKLIAWNRLGSLYAFDSWVANTDRHAGNLLLGPKMDFWLIDHGHCFSGPVWKPANLDAAKRYRNRLSEWLTIMISSDMKQKHARSLRAFRALLDTIDIPVSVRESLMSLLLSTAHSNAVSDFLADRCDHVEPIASEALGVPRLVS